MGHKMPTASIPFFQFDLFNTQGLTRLS